ncbi:MAG: helix-hairpin-helix domain-containing protein [Geminicoccaceae bacterium]
MGLGFGGYSRRGESVARKLVDHFGSGLGAVIEENATRLEEVPGIGRKTAELDRRDVAGGERQSRYPLMFLHGQGVACACAPHP